MLVQELVNTTTEMSVQQGANNSNNLSDILFHGDKQGFDLHLQQTIRIWVLFIMAIVSSAGHVCALFVQYNSFGKRNYLWLQYYVTNVLYSGVFLGYIPMLSQITFETEGHVFAAGNDVCHLVQNVRPYFHSFSNFGLVSLAISSYQILVKGYFDYPVSISNCFATLGGFYVISAVPSLLIYMVRKIFGIAAEPNCSAYLFQSLPFSCGTQLEMMLLLVFVYMLPLLLIVVYYARILSHEWSNSSYLYTNKRGGLSVSDYKYIKMAFLMCLAFVLTNIPFLMQLIIATVFQSVNINPNTAVLVEMLSLSNTCLNPFIYLMLICDLSYFKTLLFKLKQWQCSKPVFENKDLDLHRYEPTKSKASEASFVKLIN